MDADPGAGPLFRPAHGPPRHGSRAGPPVCCHGSDGSLPPQAACASERPGSLKPSGTRKPTLKLERRPSKGATRGRPSDSAFKFTATGNEIPSHTGRRARVRVPLTVYFRCELRSKLRMIYARLAS